jgi:hypothetical protein
VKHAFFSGIVCYSVICKIGIELLPNTSSLNCQKHSFGAIPSAFLESSGLILILV